MTSAEAHWALYLRRIADLEAALHNLIAVTTAHEHYRDRCHAGTSQHEMQPHLDAANSVLRG